MNLIEIGKILMGNTFGEIIGIIILIYLLAINSVFLFDFVYLINLVILPRTPMIFLMIFTMLSTSFIAKKGIDVISKLSLILFPIILIIIMIGILFGIPKVDYSYIQPILEIKFDKVI